MKAYVVHGFPERRKYLEPELDGQSAVSGVEWGKVRRGRDWMRDGDPTFWPSVHWREMKLTPRLVTDGEMNCSLGHHEALLRIAESREPGLILEDDAQLTGEIPSMQEFAALDCDLLYLAGKPMGEAVTPQSPAYRPGPMWWALAYIVMPNAANKIVSQMAVENGDRPHDERLINAYTGGFAAHDMRLVSRPMQYLIAKALHPQVVQPRGLWPSGTDRPDYAFDLKTVVFATDRSKAGLAIKSYERHGHDITVLGGGESAWNTSGEGGVQKMRWLADWLKVRLPNDIVLVSDGYDVECHASPQRILERYGHMLHPLIVSGEINCWPERGMLDRLNAIPPYPGEDNPVYRFPCSGLMIGPAHTLRRRLEESLREYPGEKDDQALVQRAVLKDPDHWRIDREGYLFHSVHGAEPLRNGYDPVSSIKPLIVHYNGPSKIPEPSALPEPSATPEFEADGGNQFIEVAPDILTFDLLSEADAGMLADWLDAQTGWQALPGDSVPGDELRLKEAGLGNLSKALLDACSRRHYLRWTPPQTDLYLKDCFAIRYSPERQPSLRLHNDISHVSATLVLRRAEAGGRLRFPRQNWTDRHLKPGQVALWPSTVTHPHLVDELRSGQRMSVILWTTS